jgi:hypothetical protein
VQGRAFHRAIGRNDRKAVKLALDVEALRKLFDTRFSGVSFRQWVDESNVPEGRIEDLRKIYRIVFNDFFRNDNVSLPAEIDTKAILVFNSQIHLCVCLSWTHCG